MLNSTPFCKQYTSKISVRFQITLWLGYCTTKDYYQHCSCLGRVILLIFCLNRYEIYSLDLNLLLAKYYDWFQSYLCVREQAVRFGGTTGTIKSSWRDVVKGSRGICTWSTSFHHLQIRSCVDQIDHCNYHMYADDELTDLFAFISCCASNCSL